MINYTHSRFTNTNNKKNSYNYYYSRLILVYTVHTHLIDINTKNIVIVVIYYERLPWSMAIIISSNYIIYLIIYGHGYFHHSHVQPALHGSRSFSPGGETTARFQRCHLAISVLNPRRSIRFISHYPLVNVYITDGKITIF